jgi:YVTN family beta-propeller protein
MNRYKIPTAIYIKLIHKRLKKTAVSEQSIVKHQKRNNDAKINLALLLNYFPVTFVTTGQTFYLKIPKENQMKLPGTALFVIAAIFAAPAFAQNLLVLNKTENTLAIVDPATLSVVAKIPTGEGPHEVIASADGKLAFVCNYGTGPKPGNSLSVIDLVAKKELRRVDLGGFYRPHGIVEADGKVYFTSELSRTVARYDPVANKIDWVMGTGQSISHMLVITPDKKRIYTANIRSDTVTGISLTGPPLPENIIQIPVGKQPEEGIAVSPDGTEVWVGHNEDGGISIIDTATNKVKEVVKLAQMPIRLKFTPDGSKVLVSDPKAGEFIVIDAKTRKEIKRVKAEGTPVGIQLQSDGKRAFVARMEAGNVGVFDLEKMEFVGTINPGQGPDGMAWAVAITGGSK